jgi:hypothetical protein
VRARFPRLALAGALLGVLPVSAEARWGDDEQTEGRAGLFARVRAPLAAIVRATPAERPRMTEAFLDSAAEDIEAVKRFRNPELAPLFRRLLSHADWRVAHRALSALERFPDPETAPEAWRLLGHPTARLREKAAIACVVLWDPERPPPVANPAEVAARTAAEEGDPHVRACLRALEDRIAGRLTVDRLADEVRVRTADGLLWTPFLDGMASASDIAPGRVPIPAARLETGAPVDPPIAERWTPPLLRFGEGDPPGMQPYGNLRNDGRTVHTGLDVGGFLDGAGLYACADGVVRMVNSGTDTGTLVVVEHRPSEHERATVLFMHAAQVVFVRVGDTVRSGRLLASLGLGYSFENGGHFTHLHLGIYPGAFRPGHNYGYRPAVDGLADWHDPRGFLDGWIDRTRPPVEDFGPVGAVLRPAVALVRDGRYAAALAEVDALLGRDGLDAQDQDDAESLRERLRAAGSSLVARAQAQRARGYPKEARAMLGRRPALLLGLPGSDLPSRAAAAWDADPQFARESSAQGRFERALAEEATLLARGDLSGLRVLWGKVSSDLAGTPIALRAAARATPFPGRR